MLMSMSMSVINSTRGCYSLNHMRSSFQTPPPPMRASTVLPVIGHQPLALNSRWGQHQPSLLTAQAVQALNSRWGHSSSRNAFNHRQLSATPATFSQHQYLLDPIGIGPSSSRLSPSVSPFDQVHLISGASGSNIIHGETSVGRALCGRQLRGRVQKKRRDVPTDGRISPSHHEPTHTPTFDPQAAAAVAAARARAGARLHVQKIAVADEQTAQLKDLRVAAKNAANTFSRVQVQHMLSDTGSTTSSTPTAIVSVVSSSSGASADRSIDGHGGNYDVDSDRDGEGEDIIGPTRQQVERARKMVVRRLRERSAAKAAAAKEAEVKEIAKPARGAGIDVDRSRQEAAERLTRVELPTLEFEVSTDAGVRRAWGSAPISPSKASIDDERGQDPGAESQVSSQSVAIRIYFEKGRGKEINPLPSELRLGGGASATGSVVSLNGAPLAGRLSVGGTQVGFFLHETRGILHEKAVEAVGKMHLQCIGLGKLEVLGSGVQRTAMSQNFITSLDDGVPVQRVTVIDASGGLAVEAVIDRGKVLAYVRHASLAEVRRQEAIEGLKEAEASDNYDFLHGRIVAARARGVNQRRLDAAAAKLKLLNPDTASRAEVSEALQWEKVTMSSSIETGTKTGLICCEAEGCSVAKPLEGEVLSFIPNATAEALQGIKTGGISHDQWLFERIADAAAAAAADGGVWRSGGKYILSAISRNQSPVALGRYLTTIGQSQCAGAIDALVKWTEAHYNHHVSAIQINVHFDASSFHAQHRDIYGLEQRDMAGRDCTCSFQPNIATACLSLGSTRRCLVEAETDDFSQLKTCGPDCKGYHCSHWLRSGCLMYFNDVWNRSHTHGIPARGGDMNEEGQGGPRISVAMLCAAGAEDPLAACSFKPKAKNIYSTLLDRKAEVTSST